SHCLIRYQSIVGKLYTIKSEDKFTQSGAALSIALVQAGMEGDYILYFKSVLKAKGKSDFKTDLLLAPDNRSYKLLLSSLGM
ncbi:MAG: hypothetical protein VB112_05190, partial [Oscillospiraceae bacterium]|nr:hypothetical protein [Oscillospiraceae bacterium]